MYASLLFMGWGMFLKDIGWISVVMVTFITIAVFITCKVEEKELIAKFGVEYRQYMKKTKLWIPLVL